MAILATASFSTWTRPAHRLVPLGVRTERVTSIGWSPRTIMSSSGHRRGRLTRLDRSRVRRGVSVSRAACSRAKSGNTRRVRRLGGACHTWAPPTRVRSGGRGNGCRPLDGRSGLDDDAPRQTSDGRRYDGLERGKIDHGHVVGQAIRHVELGPVRVRFHVPGALGDDDVPEGLECLVTTPGTRLAGPSATNASLPSFEMRIPIGSTNSRRTPGIGKSIFRTTL